MTEHEEMRNILTKVFEELGNIARQLNPKSSALLSRIHEQNFLNDVKKGFDSGIDSLQYIDRVTLIEFYNKVKVLVTEFSTLLPTGFSMHTKTLMDKIFEGAWNATNKWDESAIGGYNTYVFGKIEVYKAAAKKFTCEDLALSLLIDYASTRSLPVTITNGTDTYNSRTYEGDVESFKNMVLKTSGAHDLLAATKEILSKDMKAGDLILMDDARGRGEKDNIIGHSQVIVDVVDVVDVDVDVDGDGVDEKTTVLKIAQGNLSPSGNEWKYRDRADPSNEQYIGVEIDDREYNITTNIYGPSKSGRIDAINKFGMLFRRWNFKNF